MKKTILFIIMYITIIMMTKIDVFAVPYSYCSEDNFIKCENNNNDDPSVNCDSCKEYWRIKDELTCYQKDLLSPSCQNLRNIYVAERNIECDDSPFKSLSGSVMPGADGPDVCCQNGYTYLPHMSRGCISCGKTPCRLCEHTTGNSKFGLNYELLAVPEDEVNYYYNNYDVDCSVVQYANTNYWDGDNRECRLYGCEPIPLEVCWKRETESGTTEYMWSALRPDWKRVIESGITKGYWKENVQDEGWEADFNLTKEACGPTGPEYCFIQFGSSTSGNQYRKSRSETIDGWTNLGEVGSPDCENDLICKNCDEPAKCYRKITDNKLVWGKYQDRVGYILQPEINRDDCNSVIICDPNPVLNEGNSPSASECEKPVIKSYQTKTSCTSDENEGFYEINCDTEAKATFDLGNDKTANSKLTLYKGQGFGFGIRIEITKKCVGTFNKDTWNKVYNNFNSESVIAEDPVKSENVLIKLKKKADAFSKWQDDDTLDNPTINLKLLTNPNVEINSMNYEIISEGEFKKKKNPSVKTLASGTKVQDFVYSNEENPKVILYYPPRVYLNKLTGEIMPSETDAIDGGNKVYVGMDAEKGDNYPINITISNFKDNKTIINNICRIKIIEPTSLYRIIDVKNPFVNNARNVPKNWANNTRDYTTLIDENTVPGSIRIKNYRQNPMYLFDLKKAEIEELKDSNKSIGNNYLGTCNAESTEKICTVINK